MNLTQLKFYYLARLLVRW